MYDERNIIFIDIYWIRALLTHAQSTMVCLKENNRLKQVLGKGYWKVFIIRSQELDLNYSQVPIKWNSGF